MIINYSLNGSLTNKFPNPYTLKIDDPTRKGSLQIIKNSSVSADYGTIISNISGNAASTVINLVIDDAGMRLVKEVNGQVISTKTIATF